MPFLGISWAIEGIPPHVRGLFPLPYATCSVGIALWITMLVKSRRSRRPKSRARRLGSASSAGELVEDRFGLALAPPADAWLASTGAVSREGREVRDDREVAGPETDLTCHSRAQRVAPPERLLQQAGAVGSARSLRVLRQRLLRSRLRLPAGPRHAAATLFAIFARNVPPGNLAGAAGFSQAAPPGS